MVNAIDDTMAFETQSIISGQIKLVLEETKAVLEERGYNAVNQIAGYLISNDPAYISSYKGARLKIQTLERYEIIEELVRVYLETQ